jgi:uncharacterized sulfatase
MYPTTIGAHNHRSSVELPEQVELVTQLLRETGYFITARRPKNDYNFSRTPTFRDLDWDTLPHHQPFFAQIHFGQAHRTFQNDPDHPIDPAEVDLPPYYPNRLLTRVDWARYLETIQILDERVGRLLERLEEAGLAENTVVFLTSDHGRAMPRGKEWLYEGGIRVPLIVRWTGRIEPGQVREKLISNIDLAPTWLEIAGVAPLSGCRAVRFWGIERIRVSMLLQRGTGRVRPWTGSEPCGRAGTSTCGISTRSAPTFSSTNTSIGSIRRWH